jgi:hypothetical protein
MVSLTKSSHDGMKSIKISTVFNGMNRDVGTNIEWYHFDGWLRKKRKRSIKMIKICCFKAHGCSVAKDEAS